MYGVVIKVLTAHTLIGQLTAFTTGLKVGDVAEGEGRTENSPMLVNNQTHDEVEPTKELARRIGFINIDHAGAVIQYVIAARNGRWKEVQCLVVR